MKAHYKKIQTLAALIVVIGFVTGAPRLMKLIREVRMRIDDPRPTAPRDPSPTPSEPKGAITGQGVPPGCLQFDEAGERVGLWRDECEQCRKDMTFDLGCIRQKGIDPFKAPPRPAPSPQPTSP